MLGRRLLGGAKDALEEKLAKNRLERRLGRKVEDHELYSLGAHLEAARGGPDSSHRAQSTSAPSAAQAQPARPFDAIARMEEEGRRRGRAKKIVLVGLAAVAAVALAAGGYYLYSTRAPEGTFPAQAGAFTLRRRQWRYDDATHPNARRLVSDYSGPGVYSISYWVYDFPSEADALAFLVAERKRFDEPGNKTHYHAVAEPDRLLYVGRAGTNPMHFIYWARGPVVTELTGYNQQAMLDLEGALRGRQPAQAIKVEPSATPTPGVSDEVKGVQDAECRDYLATIKQLTSCRALSAEERRKFADSYAETLKTTSKAIDNRDVRRLRAAVCKQTNDAMQGLLSKCKG